MDELVNDLSSRLIFCCGVSIDYSLYQHRELVMVQGTSHQKECNAVHHDDHYRTDACTSHPNCSCRYRILDMNGSSFRPLSLVVELNLEAL